ncbi:MAG: hypothetical protein RLZZ536_2806, partial [Planctomycetota bacterium]
MGLSEQQRVCVGALTRSVDGCGLSGQREAGVFQEAADGFEGRLIGHQKTVQSGDPQKVCGTLQTGAGNCDSAVVITGQQLIVAFVIATSSGDDTERKRRRGQTGQCTACATCQL